jgi:molecular chaperone DnaK (HSP70)
MNLSKATVDELDSTYLQSRLLLPVSNLLEESSLRTYNVDDIVLTGNSTRMPKLAQVITDFFK